MCINELYYYVAAKRKQTSLINQIFDNSFNKENKLLKIDSNNIKVL